MAGEFLAAFLLSRMLDVTSQSTAPTTPKMTPMIIDALKLNLNIPVMING